MASCNAAGVALKYKTFAFLACNDASNAICELTRCLIHCHGNLPIVVSDPRAHFTAKDIKQRAHTHGINCRYHTPPSPGSGWPNWNVEWLTFSCGISWERTPYKDGLCFMWDSICFESEIIILRGPSSQNTLGCESRVELDVAPLTITTNNPLAEFFLASCLSNLRVLIVSRASPQQINIRGHSNDFI